jgi:hypothetical protein
MSAESSQLPYVGGEISSYPIVHKKQKLVVDIYQKAEKEIAVLLAEGWRVLPETLQLRPSQNTGYEYVYLCALLEK